MAEKTTEAGKRKAKASRIAYLLNAVFRTVGFGSNERIPTIEQARAMHSANLRQMAALGTPSTVQPANKLGSAAYERSRKAA